MHVEAATIMAAMIEAEGLVRRFGRFTAVADMTLNVRAGTILALLGLNGAGKTTIVRMLAALLAPSEGEARVAGYDVRREPAGVRASVGLMKDVPGLYEQMPVADYLDMFATIYGMGPQERRRRIDELIDFFELGEHRAQRMAGFSKGMQQKVALARALIHEPPVLFLDEPTSGLDPLAARAVRTLIIGLKHSQRTIVLCTHDLDEAERMADQVVILRQGQVVILRQGQVVARGAPAELRATALAGTRVRIEFAGPCSSALQVLSGLAGLTGLRFAATNGRAPSAGPDGSAEPAANRNGTGTNADPLYLALEYTTGEPRTANPPALARLIADGAQVVSVTCEAPSLEDVYARAMDPRAAPATGAEEVAQR
jgi:ABC-2 type transport system ATP-binding protein